MTALALRPASRTADPASFPWLSRDDVDRRWLRRALALAALLHLLVVVLPLPEPARAEPPPAPRRDAFEITRTPIPPPVVHRSELDHRTYSRRTPVPFRETADLEPLDEPVADTLPADHRPAKVGLLLVDPVGPPPSTIPYQEDTEDLVLPVRLTGGQPEYPRLAILTRTPGRVVLRAVITSDGRVDEVEVLHAPPTDLGFVEAAVEAVSKWRYQPGHLDGRPVAVAFTVVVEFKLQ